jgi:hypothetical protein
VNPNEDLVARALAHVYRVTMATTVTPDVSVIAARARRRRTNHVLGGIAVLVAVSVAVVLSGPLRQSQSLPPVGPPFASGPPTAPPSPQVSTLPEPLEPHGPDTRVEASSIIASGFLDGVLVAPASGPWDVPEPESRVGGLDPTCAGSPTDQLVVSGAAQTADGARVSTSLYLYESKVVARAVFAELAPRLHACMGYPDGLDVSFEEWSYGDESRLVTFGKPADGAGEFTGAAIRMVAVRLGRAIEVLNTGPTHTSTGPLMAASVPVLRSVVEEQLPRLCLYADAGCPRAPGLPAPVEGLSRGDIAWVVAFGQYEPGDPDARPGHGVVAAVAIGYRPAIVQIGCDRRVPGAVASIGRPAGPAWNPVEIPTRYLALYFAEPSQAEAVAALLRSVDPTAGISYVMTACLPPPPSP